MAESDEEERIWADAARRIQDPEVTRRWLETEFPLHLAAAQAAYEALSDDERAALHERNMQAWGFRQP